MYVSVTELARLRSSFAMVRVGLSVEGIGLARGLVGRWWEGLRLQEKLFGLCACGFDLPPSVI